MREGVSLKKNDAEQNPFLLETIYPIAPGLIERTAVPSASDENVIVVFETNALLLPYSIRADDLSALSDVCRKLAEKNRLFVPARSVREFIRNRDRKRADVLKALGSKSIQFAVPKARLSPLLENVDGYSALIEVPVTLLYSDVFTSGRIVEHDKDNAEILEEWRARSREKSRPVTKTLQKMTSESELF